MANSEVLAMGHLMRRNILACEAPPNTEGPDPICIQANPRKVTRQVRVQGRSRYQTAFDHPFLVKERTSGAFDYLIVVFLNVRFFYRRGESLDGRGLPELYKLPCKFIISIIAV